MDASNTLHDYTQCVWGHNYEILEIFQGGQQLRVCGWGCGIQSGHYLLLQGDTGSTRYQVQSIEYKRDPRDLWFATLTFAPRDQSQFLIPKRD